MRKIKISFFVLFMTLTLSVGLSGQLLAKGWPTKQLNIVVPYGAGGTTDLVARNLGPFLEEELGVPVVIVNRKGGGGIVGTKAHLKNDPDDGSFIVYNLQPYLSGAVAKGAFKLDDFDYIGLNYLSPQGIFVGKDSKYKTAKQLFNDLKSMPDKIPTSVVPNSWARVGNALLKEQLGGGGKEIPYNGGGAMRMAVVKGEVEYTLTDLFGTLSTMGDDMRLLTVFSSHPIENLPNIPTVNTVLADMGLGQLPDLNNFRFFMVKKGFKEKYPDRYDMLEEALGKATNNPAYIENMEKQKITILWENSAETDQKIHDADNILQKFAYFWK